MSYSSHPSNLQIHSDQPQDRSISGNHDNGNDEELERLVSPPKKNCCTWYVASAFLVLIAIGLVVSWQLLPAEDIVVKYLPKFEEPENPYMGPEAGYPEDGGDKDVGDGENSDDTFNNMGNLPGENPDDGYEIGTTIPSFMKCPDGESCCNGSPLNCQLKVNEMMFAMVHNAMSTEEGGFIVGYNHYLGLEKALVAGYRGLSLDLCNCNGELQFCHTVCGEFLLLFKCHYSNPFYCRKDYFLRMTKECCFQY